jgi:hypothetical protein
MNGLLPKRRGRPRRIQRDGLIDNELYRCRPARASRQDKVIGRDRWASGHRINGRAESKRAGWWSLSARQASTIEPPGQRHWRIATPDLGML